MREQSPYTNTPTGSHTRGMEDYAKTTFILKRQGVLKGHAVKETVTPLSALISNIINKRDKLTQPELENLLFIKNEDRVLLILLSSYYLCIDKVYTIVDYCHERGIEIKAPHTEPELVSHIVNQRNNISTTEKLLKFLCEKNVITSNHIAVQLSIEKELDKESGKGYNKIESLEKLLMSLEKEKLEEQLSGAKLTEKTVSKL